MMLEQWMEKADISLFLLTGNAASDYPLEPGRVSVAAASL